MLFIHEATRRRQLRTDVAWGRIFGAASGIAMFGSFVIGRSVFGAVCGIIGIACLKTAADRRADLYEWEDR